MFEVGKTIELWGEVGNRQYSEIWSWKVIVLQTSEKAVKLGTEGTKFFLWLPKKAINEKTGELTNWGVFKIRSSYIARSAFDGTTHWSQASA